MESRNLNGSIQERCRLERLLLRKQKNYGPNYVVTNSSRRQLVRYVNVAEGGTYKNDNKHFQNSAW